MEELRNCKQYIKLELNLACDRKAGILPTKSKALVAV